MRQLHSYSLVRGAVACLCTVVFAVLGARSAAAQVSVEGGVHAGQGCPFQQPCVGFFGPYAGVWLWDRVMVRARHLDLRFEDRHIAFEDVTVRQTDRGRRLILGEFIYHFRRGKTVRPFLGLVLGQRQGRVTTDCEPISCTELQARPGGPSFPPPRFGAGTGGMIGGMLAQPRRYLTVRGYITFIEPPIDNTATTEYGISVGVLLGRAR